MRKPKSALRLTTLPGPGGLAPRDYFSVRILWPFFIPFGHKLPIGACGYSGTRQIKSLESVKKGYEILTEIALTNPFGMAR